MSHPSTERLHALDALRAIALMLGVLLHASMSFIPGPPVWIVQDSQTAAPLALAFFVPHIFRMALFFLIAGFFARLAFNRRGATRFALDRTRRIALPFLVFWLPLFASIVAVVIWAAVRANGGTMPEDNAPPLTLATFPLTHLWFLYLLMVFYAVSIPLTALMRTLDRTDLTGRVIDRIVGLLAHTPLGLPVLAAPLALWFITTPVWMRWFGVPTPDVGFVPNTGALIAYGLAFAAGWAIHRQAPVVLALWRRSWPINLGLALTLTAALAWSAGIQPELMPAAPGTERTLFAIGYALALWSWIFGLTGLALQLLDRPSPFWRYLADSSYWVYLMHLPLVMALQVLVSDLAWPAPVKFALVVLVAMAVLLASYQLLVRHSWLGAWLNGRRARRKGRAVEPATGSGETA